MSQAKAMRNRRREALRALFAQHAVDGVLITSREGSRYFTGFTGTESFAFVTEQEAVILVDSRYIEQAQAQCTDMTVELFQSSLDDHMRRWLSKLQVKRLGVEDSSLTLQVAKRVESWQSNLQLVGMSEALESLRVTKDEHEVSLIKEAVRIADVSWSAVLSQIQVGMTEREVAGRLEFLFRQNGALGPSFETIIASGYRSAMPHGVASDKKIEKGDTIVMDFGCIYEGYCSDITRTVFMGEIPEKMGQVYDIVLDAQIQAESTAKANMPGSEVDAVARKVIDQAGYGKYFGHGLGHSLGLLIHESPNFSPKCQTPIPSGAVLSVEPGIYLPGVGGVRIEDIGMVHDDHFEVYTQSTKEKIILPV